MKAKNYNYHPKMNLMKTINQCPIKTKEKITIFTNKQSYNYQNLLKNKDNHNKISLKINKNNKMRFNKTTLILTERPKFPKVKVLNFKKDTIINPKPKQVDRVSFHVRKKVRCSSQELNKEEILSKNFNDMYFKKFEKEIKKEKISNEDDNDKYSNINIEEFIDKIKKEYSDIGKIIKINFIDANGKKYTYEKNEHVLLKIIENDLKENQGLNIKEFIFNNHKLNAFKTLNENNIENNSIIKIII